MKNYFIIDAIEVMQLESKSGAVFTGKTTFRELLKIHRLTERTESSKDPFNEHGVNLKKIDDDEFQRHLNANKLNDLFNFIDNEITKPTNKILFPSSVIISLDLNEENSNDLSEENIENYYFEGLNSCFVVNRNGISKIYVPKTEKICLIVDGQHRFYGLKKYLDKVKNQAIKDKILNFQFITSILLGYDPYQVAEVFANVNFNQKPVNKSLYYDIFGSSANDKNEIQLAHFLALHMQNNIDSPLKDMIKLLGKGYGLFSQAFFVEKLLIHFKPGGVWESLYEDYVEGFNSYIKIPVFLKGYFKALKLSYPSAWPKKVLKDEEQVYSSYKYNYILCKTTGLGAYLRLIREIYPKIKNFSTDDQVVDFCIPIFKKITDKNANVLFSKEGPFGRGGSEGFQIRLYRHLREEYDL